MIRSERGDQAYWDEWVEYAEERFQAVHDSLKTVAGDTSYEPQYLFNLAKGYWHQMLRRYSRGDAVSQIARYFPPLLDAWEEAERLGKSVWTETQQYSRHAWALNLDHYIVCFWLVGLALALNIPDDQWNRLLQLIGNEGEDALLDRVIASRQAGREIGTRLCHPQPYRRLLEAVNAPREKQGELLFTFVDNWYVELDRPAKKELSEKTAMYERPYWHRYGDQNFEGGAYFGRWCVEAVAAVKAFGIDDSLCQGHPNYPGDLLRPDGPGTHPLHSAQEGAGSGEVGEAEAAVKRSGWLVSCPSNSPAEPGEFFKD
ncbi:PoNi-like cognate immunity protein [Ralstonia solanacearum]|uniref:PoNi-like cognate immunity protein n=1 Tax=Ralstonia solanacearum TaxID=305 RepID=UPI001E3C9CAB|nr:PoNi-like cognate immunity protein [Ralstonia solanacearum]